MIFECERERLDVENHEFSTESSAEAPRVESSLSTHTYSTPADGVTEMGKEREKGEAGGNTRICQEFGTDCRDGRTRGQGRREEYRLACFLLPSLSSIKEATTTKEEKEMEGADDGGGGEAIPSWETLSVLAFGEGRGEGRKPRRRRIRSSERHLEGERATREGGTKRMARDRERR